MSKIKKVELINVKGVRQSFGAEHASNILASSKLWSLPEDSKYELTEDGFKSKRNSRTDKEPEE